MLNSREIDRLRPDVAANCRVFLARCKAAGFPVLVTGTVRDEAFQLQCYRKGTSKAKKPTFHSVRAGLAFDICKNVKGQEYSDAGFWDGVGEIGRELGFTWGGDWAGFVDKPHFQWDQQGKFGGNDILAGRFPPSMPGQKEETDMTAKEVQWLIDAAVKAARPTVYVTLADVPVWGRPTVDKLVKLGLLSGAGDGLNLTYDVLRGLVINDRAGLYEGACV